MRASWNWIAWCAGDRHAELHPLLGIGDGELERALVDAHRLRRDPET